MSAFPERFHAPVAGDIFAIGSLCGATAADEPDGNLRVHSVLTEVTCGDCRGLLLGAAE